MALIKFSTPPTLAGLFFCLAPAEGAGLFFFGLRHAGWHTVKRSTSIDTRYHRHAGRCTDQHSRPIIIRYIRMQRRTPVIDPCPAVQHSADHASGSGLVHPACILCRGQPSGWRSGTGQQSGRTGLAWHTPPGGAVQ